MDDECDKTALVLEARADQAEAYIRENSLLLPELYRRLCRQKQVEITMEDRKILQACVCMAMDRDIARVIRGDYSEEYDDEEGGG